MTTKTSTKSTTTKRSARKPEPTVEPKTRTATGPKSESAETVIRRPGKSGHTLVTMTLWTNRAGRPMGRFDCQCGKSLEIYGDAERVEQSHARHVAKTAAAE